MKEEELLDALATLCEGKGSNGTVEIEADILLNAHSELKEKVQLRKELEMARDEAQGMKPSVARKLNEKIRALEAELETLRTNKKVSELERKVKFLEHELRQSYTTKNFTLKSGLLELEKQYRAHMNNDPAMAAFWADVTVLLDEKKDKESLAQFKGPPKRSSDSATPRASSSVTSQPQQQQEDTRTPVAQLAQTPAADVNLNSRDASATELEAAPGNLASEQQRQVHSHPAGVLQQVEAFNSIISEEAAGAASGPASNDSSSVASQGDLVVRQAGGFRIVKSQQQATPAATASDDEGGPAAGSNVVEEPLQPVRLLADSYSSMYKDVTFRPLPAYLCVNPVSPSSNQQPTAMDASALQSCRDIACRSVAELQQVFDQLPAGSCSDVNQLQQQMQQLLSSAQQLQGVDCTPHLQQQQQQIDALVSSVQQLCSALHQASTDSRAQQAVEAAQQQLTSVQHELDRLHQQQQHASGQVSSQQLLVHVFGDFIRQLEQQGVMASSNVPATPADSPQHQVLLQLLQQFLQVNPQVPQLLAAGLPVATAEPASNSTAAADNIQSSSDAAVQQPDDQNDIATQAAGYADLAHAATQSGPLPSPAVHASTQSAAVGSSTAETQYDATHTPPVHASTQVATEQATAGIQAEGAELSHAMTQSEALPSPTSHVAVQANLARSSVDTQVQADLKPQVLEAVTQADLTPAAAATDTSPGDMSLSITAAPAQETVHDVGAEVQPPAATAASTLDQDQQQSGSGVIHSRSGAEVPANNTAVGQQLDVLDQFQHQHSDGSSAAADVADGESSKSGDPVSTVLEGKPEEVLDIQAVSKELSQLRADNMELAASLQVCTGNSMVGKVDRSVTLPAQSERQQELPALIYESRPIGRPYQRGMWRRGQQQQQQQESITSDGGAAPVGSAAAAAATALVGLGGINAGDGSHSPAASHVALLAGQPRSADASLQELAVSSGASGGIFANRRSRTAVPLAEGVEESDPCALQQQRLLGQQLQSAPVAAAGQTLKAADGQQAPSSTSNGSREQGLPGPSQWVQVLGCGPLAEAREGAASVGRQQAAGASSSVSRSTHAVTPEPGQHQAVDMPTAGGVGTDDPQQHPEESEEEFELPDGIKLGLGDFIFYSMLVGRAAMYDLMTVYASYIAVISGLGITLMLLALYRKALPALPVSIALGVMFYFLTRLVIEPFVVPLSLNLAYY